MPQAENAGVRRRVGAFFRKHFLPSAASPSPPSPAHSSPSISRRSTNHGQEIPQLRSHHPPGGISVADRPVTQPRPTTTGQGGTGTRRRRRRRRTQSPVGLPLYSKDPGEEEMSLFKSEIDLTLSEYPSRVGEEEEVESSDEEGEEEDAEEVDDDDDDDEPRGRPSRDLDPSLHARPSFDASAEDGGGASVRSSFLTPRPQTPSSAHLQAPLSTPGGLLPPPSLASLSSSGGGGNRPRSASAPLASHLAQHPHQPPLARYLSNSPGSSSPFASRSGLIDLPVNQLEAGSLPSPTMDSRPSSPTASRPPVALRGTWGYSSAGSSNPNSPYSPHHRSTHSSPINTLTPPLSTSPPGTSSGGGIGLGRPRSSTLQRMFASSSSRNASNASLSAAFAEPGSGRSPYGQVNGGASSSTARLASSSSASISTRDISAPLPNSFVHSSFIFPRSGPTAAQVAFISSRESLGAYGYGAGVAKEAPFAQPPTFEAATSTTELALPGAEGLGAGLGPGAGARPGAGVQGRGRSASSASGMSATMVGASSPLARVETLTPPPSPPLLPAAAAGGVVSTAAAAADAQEEDEAKTAVPRTPVAAGAGHRPSLSLDLNLSDMPALPSFTSTTTTSNTSSPPLASPPSPSPAPAPQTLLERRRSSIPSTTANPTPIIPFISTSTLPQSPPPQIGILAPTPTASAAPSPLLPSPGAGTPPELPSAALAGSALFGGGEAKDEGSYFSFPPALSSSTATPASAFAQSSFEEHAHDPASAPLHRKDRTARRASREINISAISEASFLTDASYRTARGEGEGEGVETAAVEELKVAA